MRTNNHCRKPVGFHYRDLNLIDKKIIKIQRLDSQTDYEFFSPNTMILTLNDLDNRLVLSIVNDGISCDVKAMSDTDIEKIIFNL